MRDRSHDEYMAEQFRSDPQYAVDLLNEVLKGGDTGELMVTMRQLSMAMGGIGKVAKRAHVNRTQAYRTLSRKGRPEMQTVQTILSAMDLQLYVRPAEHSKPVPEAVFAAMAC